MVDIKLLKDLCNADGIASNEQEIREILVKDINGKFPLMELEA